VAALGETQRRRAVERLDDLDGDTTLDEIEILQRRINLAQVDQLRLAAHWADLHSQLPSGSVRVPGGERLIELGGEATPAVCEFGLAELGAVLGVSAASARCLVADALDLRHRLPLLWQAIESGNVRVWVARKVASRTRQLGIDAAGTVDRQIAPVAGSIPFARLERILDAAVAVADPVAATRAADAVRDRQGVWLGRDIDHGYRSLFGRGAAPDVAAVDHTLDLLARALTTLGDTDPHDLRRAKALGVLANPAAALELTSRADEALETAVHEPFDGAAPHNGTDPHRGCDLGSAVLYLHLSRDNLDTGQGLARVNDVGPVLLGEVREWLGHRNVVVKPVLDIEALAPVDAYEVPHRMAEAIRLRTPADCFPYSPNVSGSGDIDHTQPYLPITQGGLPGQTAVDNLGWIGRRNHRVKTFGRWKVTQPRSGVWLWRTPHGRYYLVDHMGTTPLGKLN
jgi:hypothetical protein